MGTEILGWEYVPMRGGNESRPHPSLSCSKDRSLMRKLHQSPKLWTSDFQIHKEVHFCGHHQSRCANINWSSTTSNIIYFFAHLFLLIGSRVSLCSSDLSWNGYPPASAFQELGLQACATTMCRQNFFRQLQHEPTWFSTSSPLYSDICESYYIF